MWSRASQEVLNHSPVPQTGNRKPCVDTEVVCQGENRLALGFPPSCPLSWAGEEVVRSTTQTAVSRPGGDGVVRDLGCECRFKLSGVKTERLSHHGTGVCQEPWLPVGTTMISLPHGDDPHSRWISA